MGTKLVNVDRQTPLLMSVDMREWVRKDDVVHLVLEAVEQMDLGAAVVNERGTGSAQYPPGMMAGLLIYAYTQGIYSSRRIEQGTYTHVGLRYLCADTHPDHDTIAHFRRHQEALLSQAFIEVLQLAILMGMPRLGTLCVDGTRLWANASRRSNRTERQLREEVEQLRQVVEKQMELGEAADRADPGSGQLPEGLANPQVRQKKLEAARAALRERTKTTQPPKDDDQGNLTDPDSRVQRAPSGFIQGYNAQMGVSVESGLVVSAHVCPDNQDRSQLSPTVHAVPAVAGQATQIVADTGYDNHAQIQALSEESGAQIFVRPQLPVENKARQTLARAKVSAERKSRLERVSTPLGQHLMWLRRTTIEPVFGTLKAAWGFTRFRLRGLAGVNIEWKLVCTAFNLRKILRFTQRARA